LNGPFVLYTLISLMLLLWSANFIIGKVALREFPPFLLGALRIALAGLFLAPFYWLKARDAGERSRWRAGLALLSLLAFCNVGNQFLFLIGLNRTSVAHSALILGMSPIFVLLIAAAIGQERITLRKMTGMTIALAGVAVLANQASAGSAPGAGGRRHHRPGLLNVFGVCRIRKEGHGALWHHRGQWVRLCWLRGAAGPHFALAGA
jgi:drug/metabolite transporter (DMT)-like permease